MMASNRNHNSVTPSSSPGHLPASSLHASNSESTSNGKHLPNGNHKSPESGVPATLAPDEPLGPPSRDVTLAIMKRRQKNSQAAALKEREEADAGKDDEYYWEMSAILVSDGFSDFLVQIAISPSNELVITIGPTLRSTVASLTRDPNNEHRLRLKINFPIPDYSALPPKMAAVITPHARPYELRYTIVLPDLAEAQLPTCYFGDLYKIWSVPLLFPNNDMEM